MVTITDVPNELLRKIFTYLDPSNPTTSMKSASSAFVLFAYDFAQLPTTSNFGIRPISP